MPKRSANAQWEGEAVVDEESVGRQSILTEMAAGVNYSIELQDPKVHTSMVWRYFGVLLRDGNPVRSEFSCNYCALCLQDGILFKYSKATANGNLLRHLKCAHHLEVEARRKKEPKAESSKSSKRASSSSSSSSSKSKVLKKTKRMSDQRDVKFHLSREIALWLSRDLRPLSWMKSNGQKQFLKHFGVIGDDFEMPHPSFNYLGALDDIHVRLENRVKELVIEHGEEFHLTIECYNDNLRQLHHLSCSIHWVDAEWNLRHVNLGTSLVDNGPNGHEVFSKSVFDKLKEFGVEKVMYVVTDGDAKVIAAANALELERLPCVAGSISDLIVKDLLVHAEVEKNIFQFNIFQDVISKLRALHREILFQLEAFEKQWEVENKNTNYLKDFQESYSRIDSLLESEERIGDAGENGFSSFSWIVNWHLCDHFLKYNDIIENLTMKSSVITASEYKYCTLLKVVLGDMISATEILTGSKYSSLSSSLLFRSEIVDSIGKHSTTSELMNDELSKVVADLLQNGVGTRFVINEANVCAAIVDPAMKHLGIIDQYMFALSISKQDFIKTMIVKHKLLQRVDESKGKFIRNDEECSFPRDEAESQKLKKLRSQLLSKHSNTEAMSSLDYEIRKYLLVSDPVDDPLAWWKVNGDTYPYIQQLARLYLGIPATAVPFQRAFTVSGMVETAARTSLCPTNLRKMLFIHDNYDIVFGKNEVVASLVNS